MATPSPVPQSLGGAFGSSMVVPETGIALNNFMRWFDREPTSPNVIGPAKKNEICVSPAQVWDADGLRLLIGTPWELWHPPDDPADDYERPRSPDERPSRH